jgi:predicted nucleotidyltransferase component of viral defense system
MNNNIDIQYMPKGTKEIFEILKNSTFISKYTLVGGTALSLQIGHRISEDLDFIFDGDTLSINSIIRNIKKILPNYRIIKQDQNYQIDFIINNTKLTFFSTGAVLIPFKVKEYSFKYENINIATVKIIACLKIATIAQRNTIRDYYDIFFIAKHLIELDKIITQTKNLFPNLSPITYTETLVYTDDIPENDISNHLKPKENITKQEIALFFIREMKKAW